MEKRIDPKELTEIEKTIIKKMKDYRKKNKISQRDFAKMVDISSAHYNRVERGVNHISLKNAIKIGKVLKFEIILK